MRKPKSSPSCTTCTKLDVAPGVKVTIKKTSRSEVAARETRLRNRIAALTRERNVILKELSSRIAGQQQQGQQQSNQQQQIGRTEESRLDAALASSRLASIQEEIRVIETQLTENERDWDNFKASTLKNIGTMNAQTQAKLLALRQLLSRSTSQIERDSIASRIGNASIENDRQVADLKRQAMDFKSDKIRQKNSLQEKLNEKQQEFARLSGLAKSVEKTPVRRTTRRRRRRVGTRKKRSERKPTRK
jgi:hypothetical protein